MKSVPVYEAKNRFSELIAAAERGDVVSITRRGVAVARLVAAETTDRTAPRDRTAQAFARLRSIRETLKLDGDVKDIARAGLD